MSPTSIFRRVLCPAVVLVVMLTVAGTRGSRTRADIAFQYSFTADSDTAAVDSSSQQLTGQIHGARPVKSADGYALQFDGKDDYIELPNRPTLNSQMFSFELWLNAAAGGPVLSKKFNDIRSSWQLNLHGDGNKIYMCVLDPDGSKEHHVTTRKLELLNRWLHLAFVCDGRWIRLFINGEMETFAPVGQLPQHEQRLIAYAKEPVAIGASYYAGKSSHFNGRIAHVRGYDHALATADVLAHYREGHPAVPKHDDNRKNITTTRRIKPLPKIDRSGPSLQLVADGQPKATIVIPQTARYWTKTVAGWLQQYVEKATGAKLAIVTENAAPAGTLISIGHTQMAAKAGVTTDGLKWDGGRMVGKDGRLFLIGRNVNDKMQNAESSVADGNCRAVTMFLEDVVGIRCSCPDQKGSRFPDLAI